MRCSECSAKGKIIAMNVYIKKQERLQTIYLTLQLKNKLKPKLTRGNNKDCNRDKWNKEQEKKREN